MPKMLENYRLCYAAKMNFLAHSLNRKSFLIWTGVYILLVVGILLAVISDALVIGEGTGTAGEVIAYVLFGIFAITGFVIFIRRIENTGLPIWLSLVYVVPFVGAILWILLFFIPSKNIPK
jgi:uncharacterized membrane protein YhaH (DUF805 family)